jgi:hypothetical protein
MSRGPAPTHFAAPRSLAVSSQQSYRDSRNLSDTQPSVIANSAFGHLFSASFTHSELGHENDQVWGCAWHWSRIAMRDFPTRIDRSMSLRVRRKRSPHRWVVKPERTYRPEASPFGVPQKSAVEGWGWSSPPSPRLVWMVFIFRSDWVDRQRVQRAPRRVLNLRTFWPKQMRERNED